jgi:hypothetical protein
VSRSSALRLHIIAVGLLIIAGVWGALWSYSEYEAHRARLLLAEASRVHVGDTEASILNLVQRYGGYKRTPEPLSPREQWIDKEEFDYQQNRLTDYDYEITVSPYGITGSWPGRLTQVKQAIIASVPTHLRPALGMRDWGTGVELSIRGNRVQAVSAMAQFAGSSKWLGHSWELAEGMPHYDMPARTYLIGAAVLSGMDGGGEMIENYLTPEASQEEVEAARQFNTGCFTSIKGCNGLCDVAPPALQYLTQHPDADWNIIPPKCPNVR